MIQTVQNRLNEFDDSIRVFGDGYPEDETIMAFFDTHRRSGVTTFGIVADGADVAQEPSAHRFGIVTFSWRGQLVSPRLPQSSLQNQWFKETLYKTIIRVEARYQVLFGRIHVYDSWDYQDNVGYSRA